MTECIEYSRQLLEDWATLTYDTVEPCNKGHKAVTHSSYAYSRGAL